jgi:hypothetical protein
MDYFRIYDNLDEPADRWFLGSVNFEKEWDFWKFIDTGNFELPGKELSITIRRQGIPLDFTMADFELLVINSRIADLLNTDEVILIPLKITGHFSDIDYYLLYIRNAVPCLDEENAVFDTYDTNDPVRPDLSGQIRTIYKLVLDKRKISSQGIFRLGGYPSMIIIREDLMLKIKELKTTGLKFKKVT